MPIWRLGRRTFPSGGLADGHAAQGAELVSIVGGERWACSLLVLSAGHSVRERWTCLLLAATDGHVRNMSSLGGGGRACPEWVDPIGAVPGPGQTNPRHCSGQSGPRTPTRPSGPTFQAVAGRAG